MEIKGQTSDIEEGRYPNVTRKRRWPVYY